MTYQQFIGLQDKNGRDIYEGDILHRVVGGFSVEYICYYNQLNACYYLKDHFANTEHTFGCFIEKSLEVIGNILENPELL